MNSIRLLPVLAAVLLTACGGADGNEQATPAEVEAARTCDGIRSEVIRIAAGNGVNIVKIYNPKTISKAADKVVCSGRALVASGLEAKLYYRDAKDEDGDWLVEYSEKPLK